MKHKSDLLARIQELGAKAMLEQLDAEREALLKMFPNLRGRKPKVQPTEPPAKRTWKNRKMTAAEKRAISERMKKYWAKRRGEK